MTRSWRWLVQFGFGIGCILAGVYQAAAEDAAPSSHAVAFEIIEGIPDKRSWDFDVSGDASTTFTAPALALTDLPKKYNHKGLITDRKAPFVVRGTGRIELPAGEYRFLVRSRSATRLLLDDKVVAETKFREPSGDGHGSIPELAAAHEPGLAELPPENQERLVTLTLDGGPHTFRVETIVGDQKLRPELGELSVSVACTCDAPSIEGEPTFKLLAPEPAVPLGENAWATYKRDEHARLARLDAAARAEASRDEAAYWQQRHAIAREVIAKREVIHVPEMTLAGTGKASGTRSGDGKASGTPNGNELTAVDRLLLEQQKDRGATSRR